MWDMLIINPMLNTLLWIYSILGSFGLAIILFTILVRMVTYPLTIQQLKGASKMQDMQKSKEYLAMQKKYKKDKQKLQQETMEFYKKNNVNPLAGCLPLILQMPVFFALFQTLRNPTERVTDVVKDFDFLWLNLNERDPYYILVILMVVTMFLSTKLTTTDPKQSKVMYLMPVVFGFISWQFPAGILVYWVTTNIWSIGQQYIVNRIVKRDKSKTDDGKGSAIEELSKEELTTIARKKKKKRKKK